jgi:hypothetical protein
VVRVRFKPEEKAAASREEDDAAARYRLSREEEMKA